MYDIWGGKYASEVFIFLLSAFYTVSAKHTFQKGQVLPKYNFLKFQLYFFNQGTL